MAFYEGNFYELGRTESLTVDADFTTVGYAGMVVHVYGEIEAIFSVAEATGAVSDLYTVTLAPGESAFFALDKTTSLNSSQLKIGARSTKPYTEESAAEIAADTGFELITATDGRVYRLLSNATDSAVTYSVAVAMKCKDYTFGLSDVGDVIDLAEELNDLFDDYDWTARLDETAAEAEQFGPGADVLQMLYHKYAEARRVVDDAVDLLGANPLTTYQLDVSRLNDDEAPTMAAAPEVSLRNDDLRVTWREAGDNLFVSNYRVNLYDADGNLAVSRLNPLKFFYANDLAAGDYTVAVLAQDYSGNWSTASSTHFTVGSGAADGFRRGVTGELAKNTEITIDTFEITEDGIYRWQDVAVFPNTAATVTLKLVNAKGNTVATGTYSKGALTIRKDFSLTAGSYSIRAKASQDCAFTTALSALEITPTDNNDPGRATELALDESGIGNAAGYVGAGDAADYYKLNLDKAGMLSFTPDVMRGKLTLEVYNSAGKKLRSVTVSAAGKGIENLLIDDHAAYLGVVSADRGKGGYNTDYSAGIFFRRFQDSDNDSIAAPRRAIGAGDNTAAGWVGYGDPCDYYQLALHSPGWYTFSMDEELESTTKVTLFVKDAKSKTGYKSIKSAAGKNPKFSILLTPAEEYVVEINSTGAAKGSQTDYSFRVDGIEFNRANLFADDWNDFASGTANAEMLSVGTTAGALWSGEWVGHGDVADYRRLDLSTAGGYTFDFQTDGPSELGIYVLTPTKKGDVLKKIKSVSYSGSTSKTVRINNLVLTAGTYYLGVKATKPEKSAGANYSVSLNAATEFYTQCDDGTNNQWNTTTELLTDGETQSGWIGYADAADVFKLPIAAAGVYTFGLRQLASQVKLTVFEVTAGKPKTVGGFSATGKTGGGESGLLALTTGKNYFVSVAAPGAGKGQNSNYQLGISQWIAFDRSNDLRGQASMMAPETVWEGAVEKSLDPADWFDLAECGDLNLQMLGGSVKVSFYDAAGSKLKVSGLVDAAGKTLRPVHSLTMTFGNRNTQSMDLADFGDSLRYLAIEGGSKSGAYRLSAGGQLA